VKRKNKRRGENNKNTSGGDTGRGGSLHQKVRDKSFTLNAKPSVDGVDGWGEKRAGRKKGKGGCFRRGSVEEKGECLSLLIRPGCRLETHRNGKAHSWKGGGQKGQD